MSGEYLKKSAIHLERQLRHRHGRPRLRRRDRGGRRAALRLLRRRRRLRLLIGGDTRPTHDHERRQAGGGGKSNNPLCFHVSSSCEKRGIASDAA
jgi:hypothetical protein